MSSGQFVNKKFLICASGIFFCYFYYGILQEKMYVLWGYLLGFFVSTRTKYGPNQEVFTYSISLVFVQCLINTLFAVMFNMVVNRTQECPVKDSTTNLFYCCGAFSYLTAMVASNMSLRHISYPTQVIAKSCKPIPVMIVGVLYAHKSYSLRKYCFVLLIVLGVAIFMYNPAKVSLNRNTELHRDTDKSSPSSIMSFSGEMLLLLSLTMDGFTGAIQDRMKSDHQTRPGHMMLWINCWATMMLLIPLTITGELVQFVNFVQRFPFILSSIIQFSITSATGQLFIFLSISAFSSLICSLITTTRKFFTVLSSVLLFGNSLSGQQWSGAVLVFLGLCLDMLYGKQKTQLRSQPKIT